MKKRWALLAVLLLMLAVICTGCGTGEKTDESAAGPAIITAAPVTPAPTEKPVVYQSGDYECILLADGTAEITDYTGNAAELSVPDTLDGHKVTRIGDSAFSSCFSLTSITLPDSVTAMGNTPFEFCTELTDIRVSSDHPVFATIDGVLFHKAEKKLICYPQGLPATEYQVPKGIRSIGDYAFYICSSLTSITLPDGLTSIGDSAFSNCASLTSITLPDGLTSIGEAAFCACPSLTSITLPDSVTEMGSNPFLCCDNLTDIRVSPDHPVFATIDGVLFNKAEKKLICYPYAFTANEYQVPKGIRSIGDDAFYFCDSLASITLPEGITSIGDWAFYGCKSLASITLPEGLNSIGDQTFYNCRSLPSITLPKGITSIGNEAFSSCVSLTSITLPEGLNSIGEGAFSNCRSLTSITLPEGITSIRYWTFSFCESLASITLPEGLTSIGEQAFYYCPSLTSITLPEGITSIGERAFYGHPENAVFTVVRDSWAAKWCKENGKNYTYPDSLDWLND